MVPTIEEILRIKAYLIVQRNYVRDYLDVVALSDSLRIDDAVNALVSMQALQPRLMAMIALASLTPVFVSIAGWAVGFAAMGWSLVFLFVTLGLGNAAMRRWPGQHAAIFITSAIIVQAGHLLANIPARAIAGADPYTLPEFLVASVIGIFLVLLTSSFGTFRSYRENVARTMTAELNTELSDSIAASRQVAQLARESARILHGTVQTRLIACAVAIERAADTRDVEAFQAALHEAHAVLADPTRIENNDDVTVIGEVQRKTSLWSGLCDVTVDVDPQLANTTGRVARDIGRIVEEGLSNAIRHGGAGAISVSVEEANNQIVVVVEDDGAGPQGGAPGLGSSLLDSVSDSWELMQTGNGARLTVRVA
ncbi:MAG TPA: ATP-binding protein [Candidatus Nanopelagicales bacterium]|nr:ATP-binding protein [Candidatus Nanopelagicales bacterium]